MHMDTWWSRWTRNQGNSAATKKEHAIINTLTVNRSGATRTCTLTYHIPNQCFGSSRTLYHSVSENRYVTPRASTTTYLADTLSGRLPAVSTSSGGTR